MSKKHSANFIKVTYLTQNKKTVHNSTVVGAKAAFSLIVILQMIVIEISVLQPLNCAYVET